MTKEALFIMAGENLSCFLRPVGCFVLHTSETVLDTLTLNSDFFEVVFAVLNCSHLAALLHSVFVSKGTFSETGSESCERELGTDRKGRALFVMCHVATFCRETNLWLSEKKCAFLSCSLLHWVIKLHLLERYVKQGAVRYVRVSPSLE